MNVYPVLRGKDVELTQNTQSGDELTTVSQSVDWKPKLKMLFRLVIVGLVVWGIWQCVRSSLADLASQKNELQAESAKLRSQASLTDDLVLRERLLNEAQLLESKARDFWKANPFLLFVAAVFYMIAMLPAALFWRKCLICLEQTDHFVDTMWAYFYGSLGKYFPGKAMVFVIRVGALQHHGVQKTATALTIFMETLTNMAVGGFTAGVCLILLNVEWRLTLIAIGLLVATVVPASPPVMRSILPRLQKGVEREKLNQWIERISWSLFGQGWAMLTVCWLANGFSLLFVLWSLPSTEFQFESFYTLYLSCCGACALAVVLGFVSLIPGGAGVRELVLSIVLAPVVGPVAALCCAVWMRIVWLATELACVGIAGIAKCLDPNKASSLDSTSVAE